MGREWSRFQRAIFTEVSTGSGHVVVVARAGSGKTTTMVEALNHVPAGRKVLGVAFNKSIATELASRVPENTEVKTLHSLGFSAVKKAWGWGVKPDEMRSDNMIRDVLPRGSRHENFMATKKLLGLAKNLWCKSMEEILRAALEFEVQSSDWSQDVLASYVLDLLERSRERRDAISFDDMVWLPCELNMQVPSWNDVMVDETQDLNFPQLHLARKAVRAGGRIIAIGDDRQAIYRFRGADAEAIPRMIRELNAKVLPLSVTYRCPRKVVELAQKVVPDIEAWEGAEDGEVTSHDESRIYSHANPGDFVLSRRNADLMGICLQLLKLGKRARIQGRDTGKTLIALITKSGCEDTVGLVEWLAEYREAELRKLEKAKASESSKDLLQDKVDTIIALTEGYKFVAEVVEAIGKLFADDGPTQIVCSTVHKAKGLESDQVWMIMNSFRGGSIEEDNLYYVAVTRARKALRMIYKGK